MARYVDDFYELWKLLFERGEMKKEEKLSAFFKGVRYNFMRNSINGVHSLFYGMEKRVINGLLEQNSNRYLCGIVGCNDMVGYNGHLGKAEEHAEIHLSELNRQLAEGAPSKPFPMGMTSVSARVDILFSIVANVSIKALNKNVFAYRDKQKALTMTRPFHRTSPPVLQSITNSHFAPIQQRTVRAMTQIYANAVRMKLREIVNHGETLTVHIATDNWTRFSVHYCGIVGYVIQRVDGFFVRTQFLLGLPFFPSVDKLTGAAMNQLIQQSLTYLNLP